jgi:hypothetical protein
MAFLSIGVPAQGDPWHRERPRAVCQQPGSTPLRRGLDAGQEAGPHEEMEWRIERGDGERGGGASIRCLRHGSAPRLRHRQPGYMTNYHSDTDAV